MINNTVHSEAMSKENTPSHASQTFLSAGETQAAVHTEFLCGVAGGGKELGGLLRLRSAGFPHLRLVKLDQGQCGLIAGRLGNARIDFAHRALGTSNACSDLFLRLSGGKKVRDDVFPLHGYRSYRLTDVSSLFFGRFTSAIR